MDEEPKKTKRELYEERLRARRPDLDTGDEDSYYGYLGENLDELERYERNTRALRETLDRSPLFAEMMVAAGKQEGFDPIVWAVETGRLDLDALRDDPEYAKKLAEASRRALERRARQEDIDKQMAENMPGSIEAVRAKAEELGIGEDRAEEIVGSMYRIMDDLIVGKIDAGLFETLAKGRSHDEDVETAREEGVAEGLNTKVNETLRTLPENRERPGGRQAAESVPGRPRRKYNMFMDDEEEDR